MQMNIFSLADQNISAEFAACWSIAENASPLTEGVYFKGESSAWIAKWLSTRDVAMVQVHTEDHGDTSIAVGSKTQDWFEQK